MIFADGDFRRGIGPDCNLKIRDLMPELADRMINHEFLTHTEICYTAFGTWSSAEFWADYGGGIRISISDSGTGPYWSFLRVLTKIFRSSPAGAS